MAGAYPIIWPNKVTPTAAPGEVASAGIDPKIDTPLSVFNSDSGAVWSTDTCPDGNTIAVGLEDGQIRLFDHADGSLKATLKGHRGPVWCIDFHSDMQRLVSGSDDGTVRIWDVAEKKQIKSLIQGSGVRSVAFAPVDASMDTLIAVGERSGTIEVISLEAGRPIFHADHGSSVMSVALTMFNKKLMLASVGSDKVVRLWNVTDKQEKDPQEIPGHSGPVYTVAFSPGGDYLATAGWDSTIRIWNVKNGTLHKALSGHENDVWSLSFDDCDGLLASAGQDGTVRIWNIDSEEAIQTIHAHKSVCHVVRFSIDGKSVFSGGRDGSVRKWAVNGK
jgi:WD40 repeat protein